MQDGHPCGGKGNLNTNEKEEEDMGGGKSGVRNRYRKKRGNRKGQGKRKPPR